ncbi:hypothetical protein PR003_g1321 [Phytophthora rubi]|uniref:Ankyrin repeat-containing domain n=1 Tax=Phytophthora rubi TaxID=129364 RepID=A0A6A4G7E9_9STRA|nr:hypothetical protein PR002_g1286 [Phytophthora rubi]KAE9358357.1 hypothetical protein PR003_g1321 [Phytophthora rubi]
MAAPRPLELVFREKHAFAGLPHVSALTSEFLDGSVGLTLAAACKFGSRKLLDRIWDSCCTTRADTDSAWSIRNYLRTDRHYLQFQFRCSLLEAVKTGDEYVVEWLFEHCTDCYVPVEVVEKAAELGKLHILKFFRKAAPLRQQIHWGGRDAEKAACRGHSNVVWWLLAHAPAQRNVGNIMSAAVRSGDIPLMEWLIRNEFNRHIHDRPRISDAVLTGNLEVVKWMYNHGFTDNGDEALMNAASNDDLEMVSWLLDHRIGLDSIGAFNSALRNRSLKCAKYLDEHYELMEVGHCFEQAMMIASNSELEAVKWLVEEFTDDPDIDLFEPVNTFPDEPSTVLDAAVENGKLDIVQYLHRLNLDMKALKHKRRKHGKAQRRGGTWRGRGVTCTAEAMDFAARDGNLEIVQWLHHNRSEGCTKGAMDSAAGEGHLETVQWLHGNRAEGCSVKAMDNAAGSGYLEVVKWLHEHRHEGCTTKAIDTAAKNGHLHVVKWLSKQRSEGCTTNAMDGAAANGHLDVVKWLHRNRSEGCTTEAIDGAAAGGFLDVVRWLHSNRREGWTSAALTRAAMEKKFEVLLFLHSQQTEEYSYSSVNYERRNYLGELEILPEIRVWAFENSPP